MLNFLDSLKLSKKLKEKQRKKQTITKNKDTGNIQKHIFFVCVSAACVGVCACVVVGVCGCRRGVRARGLACVCVCVGLGAFFFFKKNCKKRKLPKTPGGVFSFL